MKIEIDQSGRVEYTSHDTVLADSLGNSVLLKAKDKRKLQEIFRLAGKSHGFIYQTFSLLLVYLIEINKDLLNKIVVIDTEYPGWEDKIRNEVIRISKKKGVHLTANQIRFDFVGKGSIVHGNTYAVFSGKKKASKTVSLKEILKILLV